MKTTFHQDDLMAILDSIADAVVKLDDQANYIAMNRAAADIFRRLGRDPQGMIGKSSLASLSRYKGHRC
jgi:PAS domain-containing protein